MIVGGRYQVRNRELFELGTLRGEQTAKLRARVRDLNLVVGRKNRDQLINMILAYTEETMSDD